MKIFLNLGSNLGNREEMLGRAVALISGALPGRVSCSRMLETPAWGFESEYPFLNIGVMIETEAGYEPLGLLRMIQDIQHRLDPSSHRNEEGGYIDRAIDIDIIAIDERVIELPELTVPHPRMHLRRFVLEPMEQLAPGWKHPLLHLTPKEMMMKIKN